jgi:hypothetical protein
MNYNRKRDPALVEAAAEHRRREDAAPRLHDQVPQLLTLRLSIEEVRTEGRMQAMAYVRPIVVASAPAHFEVRCMEPRCDGRHDLTAPILKALKQSLPAYRGESTCDGMVADQPCNRTLAYVCEATYRA